MWVFVAFAIAALAGLIGWVVRSFRRWPSTDSERKSDIWSRRGGGDL